MLQLIIQIGARLSTINFEPNIPFNRCKQRDQKQNLKKANISTIKNTKRKERAGISKINNWQPKVLAIEGPQKNCWLINWAINMHVCNDRLLMTEYWERPTKIGQSISDDISPGREKIQLRLNLKDGSKGLIFKLQNIYYLSKSLCNLVNLELLNDNSI